MVHIQLNTQNDSNGNPRRISLLIEGGDVTKVFDHNYDGPPSQEWGQPATIIDVGSTEYNFWKNSERLVQKCEL